MLKPVYIDINNYYFKKFTFFDKMLFDYFFIIVMIRKLRLLDYSFLIYYDLERFDSLFFDTFFFFNSFVESDLFEEKIFNLFFYFLSILAFNLNYFFISAFSLFNNNLFISYIKFFELKKKKSNIIIFFFNLEYFFYWNLFFFSIKYWFKHYIISFESSFLENIFKFVISSKKFVIFKRKKKFFIRFVKNNRFFFKKFNISFLNYFFKINKYNTVFFCFNYKNLKAKQIKKKEKNILLKFYVLPCFRFFLFNRFLSFNSLDFFDICFNVYFFFLMFISLLYKYKNIKILKFLNIISFLNTINSLNLKNFKLNLNSKKTIKVLVKRGFFFFKIKFSIKESFFLKEFFYYFFFYFFINKIFFSNQNFFFKNFKLDTKYSFIQSIKKKVNLTNYFVLVGKVSLKIKYNYLLFFLKKILHNSKIFLLLNFHFQYLISNFSNLFFLIFELYLDYFTEILKKKPIKGFKFIRYFNIYIFFIKKKYILKYFFIFFKKIFYFGFFFESLSFLNLKRNKMFLLGFFLIYKKKYIIIKIAYNSFLIFFEKLGFLSFMDNKLKKYKIKGCTHLQFLNINSIYNYFFKIYMSIYSYYYFFFDSKFLIKIYYILRKVCFFTLFLKLKKFRGFLTKQFYFFNQIFLKKIKVLLFKSFIFNNLKILNNVNLLERYNIFTRSLKYTTKRKYDIKIRKYVRIKKLKERLWFFIFFTKLKQIKKFLIFFEKEYIFLSLKKVKLPKKDVQTVLKPLIDNSFFFKSVFNVKINYFNYFFFKNVTKNFFKNLAILRFSTKFLKKISYLKFINYEEFSIGEDSIYFIEQKKPQYFYFIDETENINLVKKEQVYNENEKIYAALDAAFDKVSIEDDLNAYLRESEDYLNINDKVYL